MSRVLIVIFLLHLLLHSLLHQAVVFREHVRTFESGFGAGIGVLISFKVKSVNHARTGFGEERFPQQSLWFRGGEAIT